MLHDKPAAQLYRAAHRRPDRAVVEGIGGGPGRACASRGLAG